MKINDLILAADDAFDQWHKSADIFGAMQRLRFESEKAKKLTAIEQEPQAAWNGEGLPPVGTHAEVAWGTKSLWYECVTIRDGAIAINRNGWHVMRNQSDFEFRPIKTERELAIEAAIKPILSAQVEIKSNKWASDIAGKLYDAGLLKLPEQQK